MARKAKANEKLLQQINALYPKRSKASDGWIGDPAHAARKSDHNPNSEGVVIAYDFTNDPKNGLSSHALAEKLRTCGDPRVQYVISNKKIANMDIAKGAWRPYGGSNPHDHHCHLSLRPEKKFYDDDREWNLGGGLPAPKASEVASAAPVPPTIKKGSAAGTTVSKLKSFVLQQLQNESGFGPHTEAMVKSLQVQNGLHPDGIVGPQTWKIVNKGEVK